MVGGQRGAVMGAIATIGVVCGAPDYPMLTGAMIMGPLGGCVIKKGHDHSPPKRIKSGSPLQMNSAPKLKT
jgi:PTS system mannitol-specific IIC component